MMRPVFRLGLAVLVLAVLGGATGTGGRVPVFQLPDQHGLSFEMAPSDKSTLLVLYRGDW